eukprot:jgi/Phyca11/132757/e_gw1.224.3.1
MDVCEEIPQQDDGETLQEVQEAPRGEAITNTHLTTDDYRIIVTWMEDTTNFEAIHGTGGKPGVGGKPKVRKKDAFKQLADHLTRQTKNIPLRGLTGRNMQQRWSTYLRRFKKTLRARNNETGLGLTKRELAKKISLPEKLENMCPHFSRMLALFGEKANVKPLATVEMGVPLQSSSESGDDSDSSDESRSLTLSLGILVCPVSVGNKNF